MASIDKTLDQIKKDILDQMGLPLSALFTGSYIIANSYPYPASSTTPPWPMSAIGSAPSVTDRYPITNFAWTQVRVLSDYPSEIKSLYSQNNLIAQYFQEVCLLDSDKFIARLEHTRPKQDTKFKSLTLTKGSTYDPWYRSISAHQRMHYTDLHVDNRYKGEIELQIKVGSNHQECALIWGFVSTIDKQRISLILYTVAEMEYVNSKKKDAHLKFIHPYMCNVADDYHLRHTP
jgi:hypothetical protein